MSSGLDDNSQTETNLSIISSDLTHLSQDIHFSSEMDTSGSEEVLLESQEDEDEGQPEIGEQEVEIETEIERSQSPEEILPDIKIRTSLPPLRPLTIAPKPTKIPFTLKSTGGQQLLLLQGGAGGQPIKLVSSQGQTINLANLSMGKPIALRPAGKNVPVTSAMSVLQPKQLVMKKVVPAPKLQDKLEMQVKSTQGTVMMPTPAKTITLAQAQQIGLLAGAKLIPQVAGKQAIIMNKTQNKPIKIVPQVKHHTTILPQPTASNKGGQQQRIILKQASANSSLMAPGQIIQVTANQPLLSGQLHQINIPGKGIQYIKLVTTSAPDSGIPTTAITNITPKPTLEGKVLSAVTTIAATKSTNVLVTEGNRAPTIAPKPTKDTSTMTRSNIVHFPTSRQLVMLPANYIQQTLSTTNKVPISAKPPSIKPLTVEASTTTVAAEVNLESNGMRPRKPCNCTKSQCLKLYCDCFANGEFCYLCNCMNCFNNLENEEHRQRAIRSCLERNPNAFRPKIGKAKDIGETGIRKHTKGCNCKRSGCLKNYCECYEAKIACSSNCKCLGCRNVEDGIDKKRAITPTNINIQPAASPSLISKFGPRNLLSRQRRHSNNKHAFSFITDEVIEATSQCLLTISDSAETNAQDEELTKLQIIEEFGRCLKEIIECSMNRSLVNLNN